MLNPRRDVFLLLEEVHDIAQKSHARIALICSVTLTDWFESVIAWGTPLDKKSVSIPNVTRSPGSSALSPGSKI
jgi:hypothetical protein